MNIVEFISNQSQWVSGYINNKVREQALTATKTRLAERNKTLDDYSDDELEIIIADEERKVWENLKSQSLKVALAALGVSFFM